MGWKIFDFLRPGGLMSSGLTFGEEFLLSEAIIVDFGK